MSSEGTTDAGSPISTPSILLLLLCGLPAAGKSSVARLLPLEFVNKLSSPCLIHSLSFDAIYSEVRFQQHKRNQTATECESAARGTEAKEKHTEWFDPTLWRESRIIAAELTEAILQSIVTTSSSSSKHPAAAPFHVIVLDDNFYLRSMRHRFAQIAREYRVGFFQLFIDTPLDVAIERNKLRIAKHNHEDHARAELSRMDENDRRLLQNILTNRKAIPAAANLQSSPSLESSSSSPLLLEEMEVNETTIRKMEAVFELPPFDLTQDVHSRNWEKFSYRVLSCTGDGSSDSIIPWPVLLEALSTDKFIPPQLMDPAAEAERLAKARQETHANLLHNLDLQSRRCIQQKMQSMLASPGVEKKAVQQAAAKWNQLRKTLLADAKKVGSRVHSMIQEAAVQQTDHNESAQASLPSSESESHLSAVLKEFETTLTI